MSNLEFSSLREALDYIDDERQYPDKQGGGTISAANNFEKGFQLKGKESAVPSDPERGSRMGNTYVKMNMEDIKMIAESILNETNDMMRILFGVKALRKLMCSGDENKILSTVKSFPEIPKRLISLID